MYVTQVVFLQNGTRVGYKSIADPWDSYAWYREKQETSATRGPTCGSLTIKARSRITCRCLETLEKSLVLDVAMFSAVLNRSQISQTLSWQLAFIERWPVECAVTDHKPRNLTAGTTRNLNHQLSRPRLGNNIFGKSISMAGLVMAISPSAKENCGYGRSGSKVVRWWHNPQLQV